MEFIMRMSKVYLVVFLLASLLPALPQCDANKLADQPQPAGPQPERVRIAQCVAEGNLLKKVDPVYPQMAKIAHVTGEVVLDALIGEDGSIENLRAISGHPLLIQSAMDAVKQWKYKPVLLAGKPIEVLTRISVRYRAGDEEPADQASQATPPPATPSPNGPAQASNRKYLRVSQGVAEANLVRQPTPVYPPLAKQAEITGDVVLRVIIGKDGAVESARAISGHPMLTGAAIDAVKQWQYKPFQLDGNPTEVETTVTVSFRM